MNKLWVYGCSFSCAFQDLKDLPPIETDEGWPQIVANTIGYKYVDRAQPGYGWNHIALNLDNDIANNKISKDDIIILSPSYFQRLTFPEIEEDKINQEWVEFSARYSVEWDKVVAMNIMRFYTKVTTLRELGYNIYGWCWTDNDLPDLNSIKLLDKISNYLIKSPDDRTFWVEWILDNPECMLIPGKRLPQGAHTGDTHFSKYGHSVAAKHFIEELNVKKNTI